jgi:chromosome segregation ATPase
MFFVYKGEKVITLKREISKNHNLFFWNGARITKSEMLANLQAAGLSKCNPYSIVKQGRVW